MYVCMYVCMLWYGMLCYVMLCYVMYVCMYACKHVCMYVCMYVGMYVGMYVCMYAPGPATPPPHEMGPIYWPHMRSSPSPPVVWWGCGMVCWVCMVCMVV